MDKDQLTKKVEQNRDEINKLLNSDIDLSILYARIRMLSGQNERLIKQMSS